MSFWYHPFLLTHTILFLVGLMVIEYGLFHAYHLVDVWSPLFISFSSILAALMIHPPKIYFSHTPHTPRLIILCDMASSGSFPYPHAPLVNVTIPHCSALFSEKTLVAIIFGVNEAIF